MPSDEALARLQEGFLAAALEGEAFAGAETPLRLPDLSLVAGGPAVLLDTDNLARAFDPSALPRPVRLLNEQQPREQTAESGRAAYLHVRPAEHTGGVTSLTLEVRMPSSHGDSQPRTTGGLRAGFREEGGRWRMVEEPLAYAT